MNLYGAEEFAHSGDCPGCQECERDKPCVCCETYTIETCGICDAAVCEEHIGEHGRREHRDELFVVRP